MTASLVTTSLCLRFAEPLLRPPLLVDGCDGPRMGAIRGVGRWLTSRRSNGSVARKQYRYWRGHRKPRLYTRDPDGSTPAGRWWLLETIRTYALENLSESGETNETGR